MDTRNDRIDADVARHPLRQLFLLRNVAIVGQALTVIVVHVGMHMALPLAALAGTIGLLALFNALTWWRLAQPAPVGHAELSGQLLVDVGALTVLLYLTGGATNPFVGLYLLPLTLAAAALPAAHTWLVALVTVACYSLLVFVHLPLGGDAARSGLLDLLVSGMWINYVLSCGLIAFFVVRIAGALRQRERQLLAARERELGNEHVVRLGSLAAGAAHELGSPLATMAVLINEMQRGGMSAAEVRESLSTMARQVDACKRTLQDMTRYGRSAANDAVECRPFARFLADTVERWKAMRPGVDPHCRVKGGEPSPRIPTDAALAQAIINLLNNAADVSPQSVEIECAWDRENLRITVCDRGPGIAPEIANDVGRAFFTTKGTRGSGVGLMLTKTTVARLGGQFEIANRPDGGASAEIRIPLTQDARVQAAAAMPAHSE